MLVVSLLGLAVCIIIVLGLYISWLSGELDKHEDLVQRLLDENNSMIDELFTLKTKQK